MPYLNRVAAVLLSLAVMLPPAWSADANPQSDKLSLVPSPSRAQIYGDYVYERPHLWTWLTRIPGDMGDFGKATVQKENWPWIGAVVVSTGLLIWKDQWLVDRFQEAGDRLHISHTSHQKTLFSVNVIGPFKLGFDGPFDSGSGLYFIGDGVVDFGLAAGFLGYGAARGNDRSIATASEITESVLASGAIVQLLKHVTGRESPFTATQSGGRWRPFPNQIEYAKHVPEFDAMPSGHVAAALATVTVIADNYPEYRWIRPVSYTALGALGFQMLNNGVHWASDYPLAIALGYGFAKIAVRKGRKRKSTNVLFVPGTVGGDAVGAKVLVRTW